MGKMESALQDMNSLNPSARFIWLSVANLNYCNQSTLLAVIAIKVL